LLLYTEPRLTPSIVSIDKVLPATVQARSPVPVYFYTEFLDLNLFNEATPRPELRELLRQKYAGRHIDLIVAAGRLAVPIAFENRADLFSNAPVVFIAVDRFSAANLHLEDAITGTWMRQGWAETLDVARRFHPSTQRAVVVVGSTPAERFYVKAAHEQLAAYAGSMEIRYLMDRKFEDVLTEIAALKKNSVVLVGPFLRDGTGRDFTTVAAIGRISAVSKVPVFGITEASVGAGAVGGQVLSFEAHGKVVADLVLRVLAGERPPPTDAGTTVPMFDDRQLARWNINRRLLPPGSIVLFHDPSLWERYRTYLFWAAGVIVLQTALIVLLLVQRQQRRRAQRSLAERLRFETLLSNLSAALASCPTSAIDREITRGLRQIVEDLKTDRATLWRLFDGDRKAYVTHSWHRDGVPPMEDQPTEDQFPELFDAARRGQVVRLSARSGSPDESSIDRRSLSRQGTVSTAIAPMVEGGVVKGSLSVGTVSEDRHWPDELLPRLRLLADVFANALARQRADEAAHESARDIQSLAGRLLTAEEDERRRIGRELHDGVNQELAALSIALTGLEQRLSSDVSVRQEVARLQARTVDLSEEMRQLSHELHPGILEYAGLSAALRSHCREFDHGHDIAVTYEPGEGLGEVPADVALCLYRVTQEALRNAAMHAKAGHASVTLTRRGSDLVLTITDDGRGFDLAEARGHGLGLISLEERVRLVGGRLTIATEPQHGTKIEVVVPVA
jgi:signal transduction histidine kinase/ABC-type uncharacterized transport system substrate-binding protein